MATADTQINHVAKRRRLFDMMAGLALLLWVMTAGLWIASYSRTIGWRFFWQNNTRSWTSDIETVKGGFQFRQDIRDPYSFVVSHGFRMSPIIHPPWTKQTFMGFGKDKFNYTWNKTFTATRIVVAVPWYPLFLTTGIAAYILLKKAWRDRREQHARGFMPIITEGNS